MKKLIALALTTLTLTACAQNPYVATQDDAVVRLAAHDSFAISEELIAKFEESSGYGLEIIRLGDTGSLTNQLILTKNAPVADAFFGIDNTFQSVAVEGEIVDGQFTAIDYSDVCINYDIDWFEAEGIEPPASWMDLSQAQYAELTVLTDPALSSPGLAFLATTFAGFDSDAETVAYWEELRDGGVTIAASWEDAYFVNFTRYGGADPIVLSYASSPSAEVVDGKAGSAALLDGCFRQIEYAGVLAGSPNAEGAAALVEFLTNPDFQAAVPELMYVYPAVDGIEVPADWAEFALPATSTLGDAAAVEENREAWLAAWSAIFD